jgi:hypothetical protein
VKAESSLVISHSHLTINTTQHLAAFPQGGIGYAKRSRAGLHWIDGLPGEKKAGQMDSPAE